MYRARISSGANEAASTLLVGMPIIVLSAAVTLKDRVTALQAGASLFLAKPFLPDALVAAVTGLLDQATR